MDGIAPPPRDEIGGAFRRRSPVALVDHIGDSRVDFLDFNRPNDWDLALRIPVKESIAKIEAESDRAAMTHAVDGLRPDHLRVWPKCIMQARYAKRVLERLRTF